MSDIHVKWQGLWQLSNYRPCNHCPGISPVFICQVGKTAVLGQHSPRIKLISGIWHQVAACHLKLLFCNKSTDSLNMLYIIWAQHGIVRGCYISLRPVTLMTPFLFISRPFPLHSLQQCNEDTHLWCPTYSSHWLLRRKIYSNDDKFSLC